MPSSGDHLDVGSGTGELLRLVRAHYPFRSFGCDYADKLLSVPSPTIDTIDLNRQPLPYSDNRFALVYREVIREIYRVLQPGGRRGVFNSKHFESALPSALSVVGLLQFVWPFGG
jgi:ubiquinone/menaquinone biosynthesis C-methylase UbiE